MRDAAAEIGARWVCADLRTPEGGRAVRSTLTGIDVVVANAGSRNADSSDTLEDIADQYRADFEQNLLTAAMLVAAVLPILTRPGGRIIGIGSMSAQRGTSGSYSASKASMHGWIYALARQLGRDGITANLVNPGYVDETELIERSPEWHAAARRAFIARPGRPADVAGAVGYLASPEADFVTGQILGVNGGMILGR